MEVQKIANLEQRMNKWQEKRKSDRTELAGYWVLGCCIFFVVINWYAEQSGVETQLAFILYAAFMSSWAMLPIVLHFREVNPKPKQLDVVTDIAFRTSLNMDAAVDQGKE